MTAGPFRYRLFGLRLHSERELPDLALDADLILPPDVHVVWGAKLIEPVRSGFEMLAEGARLSIPGAGDYIVTGGNRIEIHQDRMASERNVRLFLLGSAMGLLLHQRGLLPLHANAVEIDNHSVAFMGESGAGKSTLAAWFHDRGHRIIADDVCVVGFDEEGRAWAQPGIPRFRLWRESLNAVGRTAEGLERSYIGDETYDKWDVPVSDEGRRPSAAPLSAVCVLRRGDQLSCRRLEGMDAVEQLFAHTYRGGMIEKAGSAEAHWRQCLLLLARVPLFRCERVWGLETMGGQNEELLELVRSQLRALRPKTSQPI